MKEPDSAPAAWNPCASLGVLRETAEQAHHHPPRKATSARVALSPRAAARLTKWRGWLAAAPMVNVKYTKNQRDPSATVLLTASTSEWPVHFQRSWEKAFGGKNVTGNMAKWEAPFL